MRAARDRLASIGGMRMHGELELHPYQVEINRIQKIIAMLDAIVVYDADEATLRHFAVSAEPTEDKQAA